MIVLYILLLLCALYILALQGRRNHPLWSCFRAQRFAHRGYHDKPQIPENSLPAFRRAIEHSWGAELDVHLLKDGTLAVFHDSSLSRCTGAQGMIEDLTFEELRALRLEGTDEQIPLFDEVLALFEAATPLIIELKAPTAIIMPSQRRSVSGWIPTRASTASSRSIPSACWTSRSCARTPAAGSCR